MVGKPEQQQEEAWPQKKAADLMAASVRKQNANKKWVPDTKHCTPKAPPPTRPHLHNLLLKQHHQPGTNYSTTLVYGGHFIFKQQKSCYYTSISQWLPWRANKGKCPYICKYTESHWVITPFISHFFPSHHCHTNGLLSLLTEANINLSCLDLCFLAFLWILKSN